MMQLPYRQQRVHTAASGKWVGVLLVIAACGDAQKSADASSAPSEAVREPSPVATSATVNAPEGAAPASAASETTPSEAIPSEAIAEGIELDSSEPGQPVSNQPASSQPAPSQQPASTEPTAPVADDPTTPIIDEPAATLEPGQPIPPIGEPGFPEGSLPRLVPLEFVGPITGLPVLFNIYLPPGYDSGTASYPVLYDLHGRGNNRDTNPGPLTASLEAAMRNRVIGPLIVVFPQTFPEGYWADSLDHSQPGETQIIRELIPHVEGSFRTLAHRARRAVSGFSMGGFGALAYAVKYPERFSVGIAYDGALDTWETLLGRRPAIGDVTFGNDESYFDQISPWANAERNAAALIESSHLRAIPGTRYRDYNAAFRDHLATLGISLDYVETDCDHVYDCALAREGEASWALLQAQFSEPATADAP